MPRSVARHLCNGEALSDPMTRRPASRRPTPRRRHSPAAEAVEVVPPAPLAGEDVVSIEASGPDLSAVAAARLGGRAIALAGVVVMAGIVLSRILGWIRTAVFYAQYGGRSADLDAFFAAFRIPDTLFQLVAAGAVGSALVPVASELLARGEPERARRLMSTVANLMILAIVPISTLVWIAAPVVVPIIAPSPDPAKVSLVVALTRMMLLSPVLLAIGAVMTASLYSIGIFGAPSLAPNMYNLAIIVCAIALTPVMGIYGLALGVVVGAACHVITQSLNVRRHGLYRPVLDVHDPVVRETLKLMAPRALGLGATQIVFLVNTYFALSLGNGPNSIYNGAFTALQIPVGLIGVPVGVVMLPPLSQTFARGDTDRFRQLVSQAVRLLLYVVVPLTGFMMVLAGPSIALLYQHGHFTSADSQTMTPVFLVFLLGLVAHVLIALLAPVFYAGKDTRTPVTAALLAVAVDIGAAVLLFPSLHLAGLALAIGLGAWAEVGLLLVMMKRRAGFNLRPLGRTAAACLPGALVAGAVAWLVDRQLAGLSHESSSILVLMAEIGLAGLAGLGAYLLWSWLLRMRELREALGLVRTLVGRDS
jgi:putative peptidoglycan lipid II flippase